MSIGFTVFGHPPPALPAFRTQLPWLGGDLQTIKNNITWQEPSLPKEHQSRLHFPMNDGTDDRLTGLLDMPTTKTEQPLLILVHGLTGCEASRNIMTTAAHCVAEGFPVLRLNLRGAGPSLGTCSQHYHAGRTEDLSRVIDELPDTLMSHGIVLVGISLGGNTVLKFCGEGRHQDKVIAAVSVCAPIDLKMAQLRIMASRNRLYHRYLINRMKADALHGAPESRKPETAHLLQGVATVYDYDDLIVAPRNGFGGAEDYYKKCSAKYFIPSIKCPALMIHAATDPWIPLDMYMDCDWLREPKRTLVVAKDGGHVGYHQRGTEVPWHNHCITAFFKNLVA